MVAIFEDFPGNINKPWRVISHNVLVEAALLFILLQSWYQATWGMWHLLSGMIGMATSIGRVCMIAAFVEPWTPPRPIYCH